MITDQREQAMWWAFLSAFLGTMTLVAYNQLEFFLLHDWSVPADFEKEFDAMTRASTLTPIIIFLSFLAMWYVLRRAWQRQRQELEEEKRRQEDLQKQRELDFYDQDPAVV